MKITFIIIFQSILLLCCFLFRKLRSKNQDAYLPVCNFIDLEFGRYLIIRLTDKGLIVKFVSIMYERLGRAITKTHFKTIDKWEKLKYDQPIGKITFLIVFCFFEMQFEQTTVLSRNNNFQWVDVRMKTNKIKKIH